MPRNDTAESTNRASFISFHTDEKRTEIKVQFGKKECSLTDWVKHPLCFTCQMEKGHTSYVTGHFQILSQAWCLSYPRRGNLLKSFVRTTGKTEITSENISPVSSPKHLNQDKALSHSHFVSHKAQTFSAKSTMNDCWLKSTMATYECN